jgi:superfamily II DNA or RNA helicase
MMELGASYYDPNSNCAVAGVDTLVRRTKELGAWLNSVTLCVQDEAHHVLKANKWGTAFAMFPNARGLGVTATPLRADGKGLGRHVDGLFDVMIVGPSARELINMGYLTEYRVFAPPSDFVRPGADAIGTAGDFGHVKLKAAGRKSQITGDIVKHYLRISPGKLGITFTDSVETAIEIAAKFNAAGVPAAAISADTPNEERIAIMQRFKRRELMQIVNVDLLGEGVDVPAIEVVSMGRATESYALYVQQFGRALRLLQGKKFALIIDHVGNVQRHGLPDARREWTLDRRDKKGSSLDSDTIPTRTCLIMNEATGIICDAVYARIHTVCPVCGDKNEPVSRKSIQAVDGDLVELDAEVLAAMRGEVNSVSISVDDFKNSLADKEDYRQELVSKHVPLINQLANVKRFVAKQEIEIQDHIDRQPAQLILQEAMSWWAGHQRAAGRPDSESFRRFYFKFGVDVLTAQKLYAGDAAELTDKINEQIERGV